jgi:gluconolactonase
MGRRTENTIFIDMKPNFRHLAILGLFVLIGCAPKSSRSPGKTYAVIGHIDRMAPELDAIIAPGTPIEVIAKGFDWSEGPLWVEKGNYLLFSDIPPNKIYKWSEEKGLEEYLHPSGYTGMTPRGGEPGSNALLLDSEGRLVLCQHGDRRMARMNAPLGSPKAEFTTLADRYDGKRLNSPNDAVYHKNGDLYFTDPPYGLEKNMDDTAKEIPWQGVYRLRKDGRLELISKDITRPNGIAFSPDQRLLYVANSDWPKGYWYVFDVSPEGDVSNQRVFKRPVKEDEPVYGDGMKVDRQGNLFATGPGSIWIMDKTGKDLGRILTGGPATANVAFNADRTALYITADSLLLRVKLLK